MSKSNKIRASLTIMTNVWVSYVFVGRGDTSLTSKATI